MSDAPGDGSAAEAGALSAAELATADADAVAAQIRAKLTAAFAPTLLELEDESDQHQGHGGWRPGGATHFNLKLASPAFDGVSRVARQRAVMRVLAAELAARVHALSMSIEAS